MSSTISAAGSSSDLTSLLQSVYSNSSAAASTSGSATSGVSSDAVSAVNQVQAMDKQGGGFSQMLSSSVGASVLAQSLGLSDSSTSSLDSLNSLADQLRSQALAAYQAQQSLSDASSSSADTSPSTGSTTEIASV